MAEKLETFTFEEKGRPFTHPWDEWLNGDIWKIHSEEVSATLLSMRSMAGNAAAKRGLSLRSTISDGCLVIQAYKKETS